MIFFLTYYIFFLTCPFCPLLLEHGDYHFKARSRFSSLFHHRPTELKFHSETILSGGNGSLIESHLRIYDRARWDQSAAVSGNSGSANGGDSSAHSHATVVGCNKLLCINQRQWPRKQAANCCTSFQVSFNNPEKRNNDLKIFSKYKSSFCRF